MPAGKLVMRFLVRIGVLVAVAGAGCGGTTDDRPATWSYIYPAIIQPSCATASCHSAVADRAGVNLEGRVTAYNTLLGRNFVFPGDIMTSELLHLLRAEGTQRMPPDFPLPAADVQLIQTWIQMGANDN
jgi:hypothetical protein